MANSTPLTIVWILLTILIVSAILFFNNIRKKPLVLLMHIGGILIILGAMAGSQKGHDFLSQKFKTQKNKYGFIYPIKGLKENSVSVIKYKDKKIDDINTITEPYEEIFTLPFDIILKDIRTKAYRDGIIHIRTLPDEKYFAVRAKPDNQFLSDPNSGTFKVRNVYQNCKLNTKDNKTTAYDSNEPGTNPAVFIKYTSPGGSPASKIIYEKFSPPQSPEDLLAVWYTSFIKAIYCDIEIHENGKIYTKTIQPGKPVKYNGYYFYLNLYDLNLKTVELIVVSDYGLPLVFTGFIILLMAVFTHFWIMPALKYFLNNNNSTEPN